MRVTPVPFTASGLLAQPSYTDPASAPGNLGRETTDGPVTSATETYTGYTTDGDGTTSLETTPGANPTTLTGEVLIAGLAATGFTKVVLHDGIDNTGPVVNVLVGEGTITLDHEVYCRHGLYVQATGVGAGTVWIA